MNRLHTSFACAALGTSLTLIGCAPDGMSFQERQQFENWKSQQEDTVELEPFEAIPVMITGIGKVQAKPDIAILYGQIDAETEQDFQAYDEIAKTINQVQEIIKDADVKISFTDVSSQEERDPKCLRRNQEARARNAQIRSDNYNNESIRQQNAKQQTNYQRKLRSDKPRIAARICPVEKIKAHIGFTVWISPAERAGDLINRFTEAGVSKVDLFGYDFSNYDELYKQASVAAIKNAREKAQMIAHKSGTRLKSLEQFHVSAPSRIGRFGKQATIITPHANETKTIWKTVSEPFIVQEASTELVTIPAVYETVQEHVIVQESYVDAHGRHIPAVTRLETRRVVKAPASTVERIIPAVTKTQTRRVRVTPQSGYQANAGSSYTTSGYTTSGEASSAGSFTSAVSSYGQTGQANQTNALKMTLMAGPQTVTVTSRLVYQYETPLDGIIITDADMDLD